jgi:hypothetical protein
MSMTLSTNRGPDARTYLRLAWGASRNCRYNRKHHNKHSTRAPLSRTKSAKQVQVWSSKLGGAVADYRVYPPRRPPWISLFCIKLIPDIPNRQIFQTKAHLKALRSDYVATYEYSKYHGVFSTWGTGVVWVVLG